MIFCPAFPSPQRPHLRKELLGRGCVFYKFRENPWRGSVLPRGAEGALEQWSQSHHLFIRSAMSNLTALIPLIGTVLDCFVWITNFR